jgi:hypothetical protein
MFQVPDCSFVKEFTFFAAKIQHIQPQEINSERIENSEKALDFLLLTHNWSRVHFYIGTGYEHWL